MVVVRLPALLAAQAGGRNRFELDAACLGDALRALPIADLLLDERGELRRLVNVYVDGRDERDLAAPLPATAEVRIVQAVAGGFVEIRDVAPGLWLWRQPYPDWRPEVGWGPEVSSFCVESGGEVAVIDALAPPWERARSTRPPTLAVVLKPDHVRDVDAVVARYGCRAFGPRRLLPRRRAPRRSSSGSSPGSSCRAGSSRSTTAAAATRRRCGCRSSARSSSPTR